MPLNIGTVIVVIVIVCILFPDVPRMLPDLVHTLRRSLRGEEPVVSPLALAGRLVAEAVYLDRDQQIAPKQVTVTVPRQLLKLVATPEDRDSLVASLLHHVNAEGRKRAKDLGVRHWQPIDTDQIELVFVAGDRVRVDVAEDVDTDDTPAPAEPAADPSVEDSFAAAFAASLPPTRVKRYADTPSVDGLPPTTGADIVFADLLVGTQLFDTHPLVRVEGRIAVGRATDCVLVVPAALTDVSATHLTLAMLDLDRIEVHDHSRHGTFVVGGDGSTWQLDGKAVLPRGTTLRLGSPDDQAPRLELR